tara:strand:+ start:99 stop:1187 length:1089 start_codon:yes stop_codon:yes gene_type:complete
MKTENKAAIIFSIIIIVGVISIYFFYNELDLKRNTTNSMIVEGKNNPSEAPNLSGATGYINTSQNQLKTLIENNVVLYDIWTYSCINCIRTLPYITSWDDKYSDMGLVIIGIHTPEFEFEKQKQNVLMAVKKFGIEYPVVMDNEKEIWDAFQNTYWPRKYIADHEGYIRYDHIGEGSYKETEEIIQKLLNERSLSLGTTTSNVKLTTLNEFEHSTFKTSELYFGYKFASNKNQLGNLEGFQKNQIVDYVIPSNLRQHYFYLDGTWKNNEDSMELISNTGKIVLNYNAKQVNIVAKNNVLLEILVDGEKVPDNLLGVDLKSDSTILISEPRLYNIINSDITESHELIITIDKPNFEIFTFTFG